MLHVRLDSVTEILFQQLKSNIVTASLTISPIGLTKKFPFLLEKCDSYSHEIVSFPIDDPACLSLRISLQCRTLSDTWMEFAELSLSLKPFKMNRWCRAMFRMVSTCDIPAPLLILTMQISNAHIHPFECHRTHFPVESLESEPDTVQVNDAMAMIWMKLLDEVDWPLAMRPDFDQALLKTVNDCKHGTQDTTNHKILGNPRPRTIYQRQHDSRKCPLTPPTPTNDLPMITSHVHE